MCNGRVVQRRCQAGVGEGVRSGGDASCLLCVNESVGIEGIG